MTMKGTVKLDIRLMTREQQLARMTTDFAFIGLVHVHPESTANLLTNIGELTTELHKAA